MVWVSSAPNEFLAAAAPVYDEISYLENVLSLDAGEVEDSIQKRYSTDTLVYPELSAGVVANYNALFTLNTWVTNEFGFRVKLVRNDGAGTQLNGEREKFTAPDPGDDSTYFIIRTGTSRISYYNGRTGEFVANITGWQTSNPAGNLYVLSTSAVDEVRPHPTLPNTLIFFSAASIKRRALNSSTETTVVTFGANIGNLGFDMCNGDGNRFSNNARLCITFGDQYTDPTVFDFDAGRIIRNSLTGSVGSYAWTEVEHTVGTDPGALADLPSPAAGLDYAFVSMLGDYIVLVATASYVSGAGIYLLDLNGTVIGELIGGSNPHVQSTVGKMSGTDRNAVSFKATAGLVTELSGLNGDIETADQIQLEWTVTTDPDTGSRTINRYVYRQFDAPSDTDNETMGGQHAASFRSPKVKLLANKGATEFITADPALRERYMEEIVEMSTEHELRPRRLAQHLGDDNSPVEVQIEVWQGPEDAEGNYGLFYSTSLFGTLGGTNKWLFFMEVPPRASAARLSPYGITFPIVP